MTFLHACRSFVCLVIALATAAVAARAADDTPFAVGQEWSYQTRANERASRIVILRVDENAKHDGIVHVGLVGATLRLEANGASQPWTIPHLPFAGKALRRSVTKLERPKTAAAFPEFSSSYAGWKRQADASGAQFWTVPVARALGDLEEMIRKRAKR